MSKKKTVTTIETLTEQYRAARFAFINAQSAYLAAEAALNRAQRDAERRKARTPRYEYAITMLDEHGDSIDMDHYDTIAEARKAAQSIVGWTHGDQQIVGTVIERVLISDPDNRKTVATFGQVPAAWAE